MDKEYVVDCINKALQYLDKTVPQPGASVDMLAAGRRELHILKIILNRPEPVPKTEDTNNEV